MDIGKYQVERELGRGASGVVYLARDTFRDNWVAIKQIHPVFVGEVSGVDLTKPLTREERASKVKKKDFFSKYSAEAQAVLGILLDSPSTY